MKQYRILVVDDESDVLSVSERILTRLGYKVIPFTNSKEALELYKNLFSQFDLVITDFRMPSFNGLQLCKEILKITPNMPVIICSGYASEFGHEEADELGVKWFIRKPFLKTEFVQLVEKTLGVGHQE